MWNSVTGFSTIEQSHYSKKQSAENTFPFRPRPFIPQTSFSILPSPIFLGTFPTTSNLLNDPESVSAEFGTHIVPVSSSTENTLSNDADFGIQDQPSIDSSQGFQFLPQNPITNTPVLPSLPSNNVNNFQQQTTISNDQDFSSDLAAQVEDPFQTCHIRICEQSITGRSLTYARALQIIQEEIYLSESDLDIIRKHKILRRQKRQAVSVTVVSSVVVANVPSLAAAGIVLVPLTSTAFFTSTFINPTACAPTGLPAFSTTVSQFVTFSTQILSVGTGGTGAGVGEGAELGAGLGAGVGNNFRNYQDQIEFDEDVDYIAELGRQVNVLSTFLTTVPVFFTSTRPATPMCSSTSDDNYAIVDPDTFTFAAGGLAAIGLAALFIQAPAINTGSSLQVQGNLDANQNAIVIDTMELAYARLQSLRI